MSSTIVDALNKGLGEILNNNQEALVMGEDVGKNGGVFRVTDGLQEQYGKERVFDTPLAEAGIVGTAVGMAAMGKRPIVEIQFAGFIYPAMNQIITHVSRLRNRTRGELTCPMVIRAPYTGGIKAPEHHSESPETLFCHIPGLYVATPSTPNDARDLLHTAYQVDDPVLFLEPKRSYRSIKEKLHDHDKDNTISLGEARHIKKGEDATVITWGSMVHTAKKAIKNMDASIDLFDLRSLSPIDWEAIISSIKKTGRGVIVQEAPKTCGLASEIAATLSEEAIMHLVAPIQRVTAPDVTVPLANLENEYLPSSDDITSGIKKAMSY